MQAQAGGSRSKSDFFCTHPNDEKRIAALDSRVPQVMPLYNEARRRMPQ